MKTKRKMGSKNHENEEEEHLTLAASAENADDDNIEDEETAPIDVKINKQRPAKMRPMVIESSSNLIAPNLIFLKFKRVLLPIILCMIPIIILVSIVSGNTNKDTSSVPPPTVSNYNKNSKEIITDENPNSVSTQNEGTKVPSMIKNEKDLLDYYNGKGLVLSLEEHRGLTKMD
jgi:hypothetical protein